MEKVKAFFKNRFWSSCSKLLLLLLFMFLPLIINMVVAIIPTGNITLISGKIIPGEMLAYCLSLIAPLFLLFLKTHGEGFKIPGLRPIFIIAIVLYFLSLLLTIIAKNGLIEGIDLKPNHKDLYFWLSVSFLLIAILLRLYTDFHESRFVDYKKEIDSQQQNFDDRFRQSLG